MKDSRLFLDDDDDDGIAVSDAEEDSLSSSWITSGSIFNGSQQMAHTSGTVDSSSSAATVAAFQVSDG